MKLDHTDPEDFGYLVEDMVDDLIVDIEAQIRGRKMDNVEAARFKQEIVKTLGARFEGEDV